MFQMVHTGVRRLQNLEHEEESARLRVSGRQPKLVNALEILRPEINEAIPVYRILDHQGIILNPDEDPGVRT